MSVKPSPTDKLFRGLVTLIAPKKIIFSSLAIKSVSQIFLRVYNH